MCAGHVKSSERVIVILTSNLYSTVMKSLPNLPKTPGGEGWGLGVGVWPGGMGVDMQILVSLDRLDPPVIQ